MALRSGRVRLIKQTFSIHADLLVGALGVEFEAAMIGEEVKMR